MWLIKHTFSLWWSITNMSVKDNGTFWHLQSEEITCQTVLAQQLRSGTAKLILHYSFRIYSESRKSNVSLYEICKINSHYLEKIRQIKGRKSVGWRARKSAILFLSFFTQPVDQSGVSRKIFQSTTTLWSSPRPTGHLPGGGVRDCTIQRKSTIVLNN